MKINPYIFRGYDLRGIAGKDLTPEIVEFIGKAYGSYLIKHKIDNKAVVCYDSRTTGPEYCEAITKGLTSVGIDVIDIGMTMVGTFYWSQYYLDCKGGVMVTASHNPADYNGFKFSKGFSQTTVGDEIQEIRKIVEDEDFINAEKNGEVKKKDIKEAYYDDLVKRFKINKKFKVVVDASCATAGVIVPDLLRKVGCDVIESNCNIDGTFPLGTPDPIEQAVVNRLSKKVIEEKADIGFTYDADGDRIGIVDELGGIIWNDVLVALFAIDVLFHHPGEKIMYNTLCSRTVPETITQYKGIPFMWRTGHGFLKRKNNEVKAVFIGELSGHFFFSADFYNHDDGCYATLRLLDYLSRTGKKLSDEVKALPNYISSPEIKIGCDDDKKVGLVKKISEILRTDFPEAGVIDDGRAGDGVRLDMQDSMFVVRYSQNGPYITVKFEAKDQEKYDKLKKYISDLLHRYPEIKFEADLSVNLEALN